MRCMNVNRKCWSSGCASPDLYNLVPLSETFPYTITLIRFGVSHMDTRANEIRLVCVCYHSQESFSAGESVWRYTLMVVWDTTEDLSVF